MYYFRRRTLAAENRLIFCGLWQWPPKIGLFSAAVNLAAENKDLKKAPDSFLLFFLSPRRRRFFLLPAPPLLSSPRAAAPLLPRAARPCAARPCAVAARATVAVRGRSCAVAIAVRRHRRRPLPSSATVDHPRLLLLPLRRRRQTLRHPKVFFCVFYFIFSAAVI
jgi:hypothetical protein